MKKLLIILLLASSGFAADTLHIVLDDSTNVWDTYNKISGGSASNQGVLTTVQVSCSSSVERHGFIYCDVRDTMISVGGADAMNSVIVSALLNLHSNGGGSGGVFVAPCTTRWHGGELGAVGHRWVDWLHIGWDDTEPYWTPGPSAAMLIDSATVWPGGGGGRYDHGTPVDTLHWNNTAGGGGVLVPQDYNVTSIIQDQLDTANHVFGFYLGGDVEGDSAKSVAFISSEDITGNYGYNPTLDVYFIPPPTAPADIAISVLNCGVAEISYDDSSNTDSVEIWDNGSKVATVAVGVNTYNDSTTAGPHVYRLVSWNIAGADTSAGDTVTVVGCDAYTDPVITSVTSEACSLVTIVWTADATTTWSFIYQNFTLVDSTEGAIREYTDTVLVLGTTCFMIWTVSATDTSNLSECEEITLGVPSVVTGLIATADEDSVYLDWSAVADTDSYYVYVNEVEEARTDLTAYSYFPDDDSTYSFTVSAVNDCGEGAASAAISRAAVLTAKFPWDNSTGPWGSSKTKWNN
jgi:hypothetical protein